jgi:hypothetical protein
MGLAAFELPRSISPQEYLGGPEGPEPALRLGERAGLPGAQSPSPAILASWSGARSKHFSVFKLTSIIGSMHAGADTAAQGRAAFACAGLPRRRRGLGQRTVVGPGRSNCALKARRL